MPIGLRRAPEGNGSFLVFLHLAEAATIALKCHLGGHLLISTGNEPYFQIQIVYILVGNIDIVLHEVAGCDIHETFFISCMPIAAVEELVPRIELACKDVFTTFVAQVLLNLV